MVPLLRIYAMSAIKSMRKALNVKRSHATSVEKWGAGTTSQPTKFHWSVKTARNLSPLMPVSLTTRNPA